MNAPQLKSLVLSHKGKIWISPDLYQTIFQFPEDFQYDSQIDLKIELETAEGDQRTIIVLSRTFDPQFFWGSQASSEDILLYSPTDETVAYGGYFPGLVFAVAPRLESEGFRGAYEDLGVYDFILSKDFARLLFQGWDPWSILEWAPEEVLETLKLTAKILFLDRDDVIIKDVPYNKDPQQVFLMDGFSDFLRVSLDKKYLPIMVTNQSGVGRGRLTPEEFLEVHQEVLKKMAQEKLFLSESHWAFFHDSSADVDLWRYAFLRKPRAGMFFQALARLELSAESMMVGDKATDLFAAYWAGVRNNFLIRKNFSEEDQRLLTQFQNLRPDFSYEHVSSFDEITKKI